MNCIKPKVIIQNFKENVKQKRAHLVRCGQCINCKIHRAREWTNRLVDEATQYSDISIIVLTYDNEHIRWGEKTKYGRYGTLWHEDVQNYLKRVKITLDRQYKKGTVDIQGKDIKYYIAGEYGEAKKRPHYHIVLYGLNGLKNKKHREIVENCWKMGNVMHDHKTRELTPQAFAYVAQYVQKKIYSKKYGKWYTDRGITAPYNISSKGIGKRTAIAKREIFERNDYTYKNDEYKSRAPRYYIKIWKQQDLQRKYNLYEKIRDKKISPEEAEKQWQDMWRESTEYKLIQLYKQINTKITHIYEKEGIITDYHKLTLDQCKKTLLWEKIERKYKPKHNLNKQKILKIRHIIKKIKTKKPLKRLDETILSKVYLYQQEHNQSYELEQWQLYQAKKLAREREKRLNMPEKKRNKDGQ